MNWLIENWVTVVALTALLVLLGSAIFNFFKLPTNKQLDKVKEWLLYAVTLAEKEFQNGTGQIKLRFVYDMFINKFKWTSRLISFEVFSVLVDEALDRMRKMLVSNKAVKELITGELNEK